MSILIILNGDLFKYCFVSTFKKNSMIKPHRSLFDERGLILKNELWRGCLFGGGGLNRGEGAKSRTYGILITFARHWLELVKTFKYGYLKSFDNFKMQNSLRQSNQGGLLKLLPISKYTSSPLQATITFNRPYLGKKQLKQVMYNSNKNEGEKHFNEYDTWTKHMMFTNNEGGYLSWKKHLQRPLKVIWTTWF